MRRARRVLPKSARTFQSAPGREAGRCALWHALRGAPVPVSIRARPGGRAMPVVAPGAFQRDGVSIRARPGGRAMRSGRIPLALELIVSIRARPGGRAMLAHRIKRLCDQEVSIRARPGGRAMLLGPLPRGNRAGGFNPRPAGRPGDAILDPASIPRLAVSIRARPGGRAMPFPHRHSQGETSRFNPRPAGRPGDARYLLPLLLLHRVSIRARPGGRAMPDGSIKPLIRQEVSIRARPGGRAMRVRASPSPASVTQFQSAPGREAGRCPACERSASRIHGFNPRPAGRPGDATGDLGEQVGVAVSIRARPGGRAMHGVIVHDDVPHPVSIRARPGGRAMPRSFPRHPPC